MTEETAVSPEDSYGIAKHAVELELRACREMFGLNYVIFRPHNVFGPRQNIGDRYRNVVGIFMNQILQGQPMTIFGDGTQTRAFSYIDDVAPMMAEAIDVPACWNQTFNIGADQPYSLLQLATAVSAAMGVPPRVTHLEARREVQHAHSTHDKARRVFGAASADIARGGSRSDGGMGAPARREDERGLRRDRDREEPSGVMAGTVTGYHAAHLPEDPARAIGVESDCRSISRHGCRRMRTSWRLGAGYCDWINNVSGARRVAVDIWPDVARYAAAGRATAS